MEQDRADRIDEFLDWSVIGFDALRGALDVPFLSDDERPQSEYPFLTAIPREVRRHWHPMVNQLYLYWRSKLTDSGAPPDRSAMDPLLEIPALCPHLSIFEPTPISDKGRDWYCRIMGTHVEEALGFSLTGRLVSDFIPALNHPQTLRYSLVVFEGNVSHRRGPSRTPVEDRFGWAESLYLPITDHRRGTKAALGVAIYEWLSS